MTDDGQARPRRSSARLYVLSPTSLFAQMQSPELAPPHWEPAFVDYLYLSFTKAAAFSPTGAGGESAEHRFRAG